MDKDRYVLFQEEVTAVPEMMDTMHVDHKQTPDTEKSSSAIRRQGHVSFSDTVHVYFIIHVNDIHDDDYFNIWYQSHDFKRMREECKHAVGRLESQHNPRIETHYSREGICTRGLECRTRQGSQQRSRNKLRALRAVMKEQDRQESKRMNDVEALRNVYAKATLHCRESARFMGECDEAIATELLREWYALIVTGERPIKTAPRKTKRRRREAISR
eukprot:CAMPEP_0116849044 /NCGR_PEP_ID=MMETSP0418-20121206/15350_1 /TAXON_ID=1158023 /ORGANISM="Astrosyne radiata, Strain 13vi08-1A" /LENGTH=215 /DNA_ID=CAMNT_0004480715 /DNA_START=113 /DNA_END=760 /DNA_ORIENTATION=-